MMKGKKDVLKLDITSGKSNISKGRPTSIGSKQSRSNQSQIGKSKRKFLLDTAVALIPPETNYMSPVQNNSKKLVSTPTGMPKTSKYKDLSMKKQFQIM